MKLAVAVLLAGLPAAAQAGCFGAGEPLFHCRIEGSARQVDICLQDGVALYRFGPMDGAAEMILARRVEDVGLRPWNGIGRWLHEALRFTNGETAYEISYGIDRLSETHVVEAGIAIHESGREIARLACRPETVLGLDFTPLFEAKLAAGQSWCPEAGEWRADCVAQ